MKKIYLFCAAGMSTSLLVNKMKEHATKHAVPVEIQAFSEAQILDKGPEADLILLGPQIKYMLNDFTAKFSDKPVHVIDSLIYGKMDGLALLKFSIAKIKEHLAAS